MTGAQLLPAAAAAVLAVAASGCLGTGTRRVDAPCREMRASVAREMLRDSREIPLLDVRSSRAPALRGAIEIPPGELARRLDELARHRKTPLIVVGDDGPAAQRACEVLAGSGFRWVIFVPEGADGLFAGVRGTRERDRGPGEERP